MVVENDEILIFKVATHGIRDVSQFNLRGGGRERGLNHGQREFFEKSGQEAKMVFPDGIPLIICGPGLAREVRVKTERSWGKEQCGECTDFYRRQGCGE